MVREYNLSFLGIVIFAILLLAVGFGVLLTDTEWTDPAMSQAEADALATSSAIEARGTEIAMNNAISAETEQQQRTMAQTAVAAQSTTEAIAANAQATAEMSAAIAEATRAPLELAATSAAAQSTTAAGYALATQSAVQEAQRMDAFNAESTRTAVLLDQERVQSATTNQNIITLALIAAGFIVLAVGAYIFAAQSRSQDNAAQAQRLREERNLAITRMRATEAQNRMLAQVQTVRSPQPSQNGSRRPERVPERAVERAAVQRTNNGHANGHSNGHSNGHANGHSNGHANGSQNPFAGGYDCGSPFE